VSASTRSLDAVILNKLWLTAGAVRTRQTWTTSRAAAHESTSAITSRAVLPCILNMSRTSSSCSSPQISQLRSLFSKPRPEVFGGRLTGSLGELLRRWAVNAACSGRRDTHEMTS